MLDATRPDMARLLHRHRIICFVVVTYGVTWGLWIPLAISGHRVIPGFSPVYLGGLLGPLIGAVVTTALVGGRQATRDLFCRMARVRVGLRWWGIGLGLPLAVAAATYVVMIAYSMVLLVPIDPPSAAALGRFNGFPIGNVLGTWVLLVVVNGFGEETGWRGFLLPQLTRRRSPLIASLIVGVVWALWHIPAFWISETYRLMSPAVLPMFFVGFTSGAVFLAWLYTRGHSSILLAAVWHGTYNLLSGSVGARGVLAAAESSVVVIIAATLVIRELRAMRREHSGRPAHHAMTA
jgi:membrane protease YdiL (CAAX protease family)